MIASRQPRVLIIGGGVAGGSCATMLARSGVAVDLVEKSAFPRSKVCGCCLGPAGLEMLSQLSLLKSVSAASEKTNRWLGSLNGRSVDVPLPSGIAVSREVLDPLVLDAAGNAGANVVMQCEAELSSVDDSGVTVWVKTASSQQAKRYDIVVVAAGLNASGLDSLLPWQETPHGPFGVSFLAESSDVDAIKPRAIYMACDDDGYVGIVRLPRGQVDVAAALRSGGDGKSLGTPMHRINRILDRSAFDLPELSPTSPVMTTSKLRRTRLAGNGRVIAIGDAAGYVEPFTGEGMTWAMQSGIASARLIASLSESEASDWVSLGESWQSELRRILKRKKRMCRLVTSACRSRLIRESAARTLAVFPSLVKPLLSSMNRV